METIKKIATTVLLITLFLGGLWVAANWKHLNAFPSILPSFYAKEFCSCHFVMQRSEVACHAFARQWIEIDSFQLDAENKRVTVSGLGRTHSAIYTGERTGCRLE